MKKKKIQVALLGKKFCKLSRVIGDPQVDKDSNSTKISINFVRKKIWNVEFFNTLFSNKYAKIKIEFTFCKRRITKCKANRV